MTSAAILINYNDKENTIRFALELQSYKVFNKVLIVDNCSPNEGEAQEIANAVAPFMVVNQQAYLMELNSPQHVMGSTIVEVIKTDRNGGYNYALNYGVKYLESKGENYHVYMMSNTDITISILAIKECLEEMATHPQTAVTAPRMKNSKGVYIRRDCWKERTINLDIIHSIRLTEALFYGKLRAAEYKDEDFLYLNGNKRLRVECISGSLFFIRSSVLKAIGYFDQNVFLFYEEDILYKKIQQFNPELETICIGNVEFLHYESQSIGKAMSYYKKMKQLYDSKIYYHKTYNGLTSGKEFLFKFLWIIRTLEIFIEIPIRKFSNWIETFFVHKDNYDDQIFK